jgi:hypothetical protein
MGNRAYVGPAHEQPYIISDKTVGSALLPCTFVTEGASAFTQATAFGPNLRLLTNRDFYSIGQLDTVDPLLTAYVSGETASAFVLKPGQRYMVAAAAATYTFGQEVTVAAAGRAAGAASTNVVIGFAREAGVRAAGALIEIEIAMPYVKA